MAEHKHLIPPKTDTTLPVPTLMRVIQAQELHASLNQSPDGASVLILNILLSKLNAEIRLKINYLEKKIGTLKKTNSQTSSNGVAG